ncbi:MAG: ATPase, T2SS/T4P/T4SS family, partial [Pyrinomonadaceae bacterium]
MIDVSAIDDMLWVEATSYRDWHVDQAVPDKSVVFRPQVGEEKTAFSIPSPVPRSLQPVLQCILDALAAHLAGGDAKSFKLDVAGRLNFRGERIRANRYALRIAPNEVPSLSECQLGREATALLLEESFRHTGGLVLIAGDTGAGKSTTAYAAVKDRLIKYGGYCLTVEDPPERELEGFHGEQGYCEQVNANANGFKYEVASAMRKFPAETRSMFF